MDDLELFDLDDEDIDAADDANYIADEEEETAGPSTGSGTDGAGTGHERVEGTDGAGTGHERVEGTGDTGTDPERVEGPADKPRASRPGEARGSMFPIRTAEGLVHQERRRKPRPEKDPAQDETHPDYAITLTKGVTNKVVKRFFFPHTRAQLLAIFSFLLGVALLCFFIFSVIYIIGNHRLKIEQSRQVEQYRQENEALIEDNVELRSLVNQLSVSVNRNQEDRLQEERAYEASLLPKGYPLSRISTMELAYLDTDGRLIRPDAPEDSDTEADSAPVEEPDDDTDGTNPEPVEGSEDDTDTDTDPEPVEGPGRAPIALFTTDEDAYVLASGTGVVTRIIADPNFGTMLSIDHRNGYSSIYRVDGAPLVDVGDNVIRGDRLFSISVTAAQDGEEEDGEEAPSHEVLFGYQIHLNESYINPADMIELNG